MPSPQPTHRAEYVARQYGNYVIMQDGEGKPKFLGKGTFGRTYLAQHQYLETLAALKVINERFAAETSARDSFLREGRALVRLDHRHIARLLDFGEMEGALFYAMEYCAGGNLASRVQNTGPLPIEQWLSVARQLTSALECCHRAGFIHRDLKPSNVMLAHEGDPLIVKLIDFGLVHAERKEREGDPAVVGTPLYASPEQLREEKIDARSDLFSLGVTLWQLALGAPPESGSFSQIIASRLGPESYAGKLPPHLPASVRHLLGRLLEKDVAGRPASAAETGATLADISRELGLSVVAEASEGDALLASEESAQAPLQTTDPEPIKVITKSTPLMSEWEIESNAAEQNTGVNYLAHPLNEAGARRLLHVLHPQLVTDQMLFRMFRVAVARLTDLDEPDCLRPVEMRAYPTETVLLAEAPDGDVLSAFLKEHGKVSFAAALPLLRRISETCDRVMLAGLPGVELRANCIYVSPEALSGSNEFQVALLPRLLHVRDTADMTAAVAMREGVSGTMTAELLEEEGGADRVAVLLARLIYRLVAGRDCPAAATGSDRAFVRVADLSETHNRLLAQVISGQTTHATCGSLLAEMQGSGAGGPTASRSANRSASHSTPPNASRTSVPRTATAAPRGADASATNFAGEISAMQTHGTYAPPDPAATRAPAVRPLSSTQIDRLAEPPKSRMPLLAIIGALVFLLLGGAVLMMKHRSPTTTSPAAGSEKTPANATLRLVGDLPARVVFSLDGEPLPAQLAPGSADLALPADRPLPLEITVKAPGFLQAQRRVESLAELQKPQPIDFERSKGMLVVSQPGPTDYAVVTAKMYATLPQDEGIISVATAAFNKGMPAQGGEPVRWPLPTGKYDITLQGKRSLIHTRVLQQVTLEEASEQACVLPPSFAGTYQGDLSLSGGTPATFRPAAGSVRLTLNNNLTEGELIENQQHIPLDEITVDSNGVLKATARFSTAPSTQAYDQQLTARLSEKGDEIELKFAEMMSEDPALKAAMKRPAMSENEWGRSGRAKRVP